MAEVERAVILEMASDVLRLSMSRKSSSNSASPVETTYDKLMDRNEVMNKSHSEDKKEDTVLENGMTVNVLEMKWKKDQGNSTESPMKFSLPNSASHFCNRKMKKRISQDRNHCNPARSWYVSLPFTQKKSPSHTSTLDQHDKSKKPISPSWDNHSTESKLTQDGKSVNSQEESNNHGNSSKLKQSVSRVLNGHNLLSKHAEKSKCSSSLLSKPLHHSDVQESLPSGKSHVAKLTDLEEITQKHGKFQDQAKDNKTKQKMNIDQQSFANQANKIVTDKGPKTCAHKHKERTLANTQKLSEVNQCFNCQMKAKRISLVESSKADSKKASIMNSQVSSSKRNRNCQPSGSNGEGSILSNNVSNFQLEQNPNSHRCIWNPTSEGIYVTFSHCDKPTESHSISQSSRSSQMVASYPRYPEKSNEKEKICIDTKVEEAKLRPKSKSKYFAQNMNMSATSSNILERPDNLLTDSVSHQNVLLSSEIPKSTQSNLSFFQNSSHDLTFSRPRSYCVGIASKNVADTQDMPLGFNRMKGTNENASSNSESMKRHNGGEYNNLSLDMHPVHKSYMKRIPWNGGNINSETPLPDPQFIKGDSGQLSHLFNENEKSQEENLHFVKVSDDLFTAQTKDSIILTSSSSVGIQAENNGPEVSNLKDIVSKKVESDDVSQQIMPIEEQNWHGFLTSSHDYFDWKYRLCFDTDDQDGKNSNPPFSSEKLNIKGKKLTPSSSSSLEGNNDGSCPSVPLTVREKNRESCRYIPCVKDSVKLPNGKIHSSTFFTSAMNTPLCASVNQFDEYGKKATVWSTPRKTDSPGGTFCEDNGFDAMSVSVQKKPLDLFSNDSCVAIKEKVENENSVDSLTNHFKPNLSDIGFKNHMSLIRANQLHLPKSTGTARTLGSPCSSLENGKEISSGVKQIDYTKSISDALCDSSISKHPDSSPLKEFRRTSTESLDSCPYVASHNSVMNGNNTSEKENLIQQSSFCAKHSETAPSSLSPQKLFPPKYSAQEAVSMEKLQIKNTDMILSPNDTCNANDGSEILTGHEKRKVDGKSFACQNSTSFNHHTLMSYMAGNHLKNSGHCERSPVHLSHSALRHKIDKINCNGRDSPKPCSESSGPTSNEKKLGVLPPDEYTASNSTNHDSKSKCHAQFFSETKQSHNLHLSKALSTNDYKSLAMQKKESKNSVQANDITFCSPCSSQRDNEIQFLKLTGAKDRLSSQEFSASQISHNERKESEKDKVEALQVRYTPKGHLRKKETIQKNGIPVTSRHSDSSLSPCFVSDDISFLTVPTIDSQSNITSINHNLSASSRNAKESLCRVSSIAGPDLLQATVFQPDQSQKSDCSSRQSSTGQSRTAETSTRSQPKKQSFFARLAHSPLSFLHRDSKNATDSK